MRSITIASLIAVASAIKVQESAMDEITNQLIADFDTNWDGEIDENEFLEICTYLDEDQSLTDDEKAWALQQYSIANPECAIWLTDTFSSTAGGE